ncbi:MAG: hypothetical protein K2G45_09055 [Lachnospiraceae bacterium]|nr:hypothetical protein [Lachnospiraceae bacterium]
MNKKKMISIACLAMCCVICIVMICVSLNNKKGAASSDNNITADEYAKDQASGTTTEELTVSNDYSSEELERFEQIENDDAALEHEGNIRNFNEPLTYGGVTIEFKEAGGIPDISKISEILPGYDEKYRGDTDKYMSVPLAERGDLLRMGYIVFDVTNTTKLDMEYNPISKVNIAVVTEDGRIYDALVEPFYIGGADEKKLNTRHMGNIDLESGETKEIVYGLANWTMPYGEDQIYVFYITIQGMYTSPLESTIEKSKGNMFVEIYRGTMNDFVNQKISNE